MTGFDMLNEVRLSGIAGRSKRFTNLVAQKINAKSKVIQWPAGNDAGRVRAAA